VDPLTQRGEADDEKDRHGDEASLAESSRDRPRFHRTADVDLQRHHEHHARADAAPLVLRRGHSRALRCRCQQYQPCERQQGKRRPEQEAVFSVGEHLQRVRRVPVHLPRHQR
jgi:hypothetical protein